MSDDKLFAIVPLVALLFWLAARGQGVPPAVRPWLHLTAWGVLGLGLAYAILMTIHWAMAP
jgi:hypothetical protein